MEMEMEIEADSQSQLGQLGGWSGPAFKPVLQRQRRQTSPCNDLPCELLSRVLQLLDLQTKLRAQLCCRRWNALLSRPQDPGLWGTVKVDLKMVIAHLSLRQGGKETRLLTSARAFFQPVCRWIAKRSFGISTLELVTTRCIGCEAPDEPCVLHTCKNCPDAIDAGVAMIMGSLPAHALEVNLLLESCAPGKPMGILQLGAEPIMQQCGSQQIFQSQTQSPSEWWQALGQLTTLTSLSMRTFRCPEFSADADRRYTTLQGHNPRLMMLI
ncbi:hypothetical protein WJX73_002727 [Symbiochloris irregularis]|uniref:F-box domain-containing protein n=1 Tax=Symbiochloris irregularis TaxID=706552 RepID=A0AAW1P7E6_9CHLO